MLANAGLALPPVLVGLVLFLLFVPQGPLGSLHLLLTRRAVFIAQSVLALPYVVALTAAAVQGLGPGFSARRARLVPGACSARARAARGADRRAGGADRRDGHGPAEVGAVVIVGGNVYGYDQTLASAALFEADAARLTRTRSRSGSC